MVEQTLAQLEAELMAAHNKLATRRQEARIASANETDAINAVNDAQKRIDAHMEKLRSGSLHGTDWASKRARGVAA
jgi:hypothetical protein